MAATAWWVVHHRAERGWARGGVQDPAAAELLARSGLRARELFGRPSLVMARYLALRARLFDEEVRAFLGRHPTGTVVHLGAGLDDQAGRLDNGTARWLTVDLPQVVDWRRELLPQRDRQRSVACSVTDPRWAGEVDAAGPVHLGAQGLLHYLTPEDATGVIGLCAERFPHATLVFDVHPRWLTVLSHHGLLRTGSYRLPPMRFDAAGRRHAAYLAAHPRIAQADVVRWPAGCGVVGAFLRTVQRLPLARRLVPEVVRARTTAD